MIIKAKSMREQVYETLKEAIISGEIKAGEKIVEVEYSQKYGVSRTPLREAIRMLELEGLVTTAKKGGVFVNDISEKDIVEIYKIRMALESLVLKEIIEKYSEDLTTLENILCKTENYFQRKANIDDLIDIFKKFNNELYRVSQLEKCSTLVSNLNEYIKRFRVLCLEDTQRLENAFLEHKELLKALQEKKLEKALEINEKHLMTSMNFVLKKIKEKK